MYMVYEYIHIHVCMHNFKWEISKLKLRGDEKIANIEKDIKRYTE